MSFLKPALFIILAFAFITPSALADEGSAVEECSGERLLRQIWADMKSSDMEAIEKTVARGFQSVHQYGANTREQEIELIRGLKLGEYVLSKIKITQNGPVIIASYFVSVEETIKGKRLMKEPAPRLSVFLKTDLGWQWIAHANLRAMK